MFIFCYFKQLTFSTSSCIRIQEQLGCSMLQRHSQDTHKYLRWRILQQQFTDLSVNYCCKVLHLRYLLESWQRLCITSFQFHKLTNARCFDSNTRFLNTKVNMNDMKNTSTENVIKLSVSKVNFRINLFPTYICQSIMTIFPVYSRVQRPRIDFSISITTALTLKISAKNV